MILRRSRNVRNVQYPIIQGLESYGQRKQMGFKVCFITQLVFECSRSRFIAFLLNLPYFRGNTILRFQVAFFEPSMYLPQIREKMSGPKKKLGFSIFWGKKKI